MAKYTLKALNVVIGGKLFKREDKFVFDTNTMNKKEIEDAAKAGFLEEIVEKETPAQKKAREEAEAKAKAEAEAKAKAEAEAKAKEEEEEQNKN